MRNFDAVALVVIVVALLGFSQMHSSPRLAQSLSGQSMSRENVFGDLRGESSVFRSALREQIRSQIRNQIRVLKCQIR